MDGLVVFADICSILEIKGRALGECRKQPIRPAFVVVFLFGLAPLVFPTGQGENRLRDATALIAAGQSDEVGLGLPFEVVRETVADLSPNELLQISVEFAPLQLLELAGILIDEREYNKAAVLLSATVVEDEEQLYVAEEYFEIIRQATAEYIAKGEEVRAKLEELLSEDIPDDELVPTAIAALELIAEMEEIIPNPNPRDAVIIEDLLYTVQLNIDRRRFESLMNAAAARLAVDDFAGAATIYVNGLVGTESPQPGETADADDTTGTQTAITLENGLDIQRRFFEDRDYGILGDQVESTRETLREIGNEFAELAPDALAHASALVEAFSGGDFAAAQTSMDEYLPALQSLTEDLATVVAASETLQGAEEFTSRQALEDDATRLDWHIIFLSDIVLGRDGVTVPEGILYAVNAVREMVEAGPVSAARDYGERTYKEAIALIDGASWPQAATGFGGRADLESTYEDASELLSRASTALRTYTQVLSVSRSLDVPEARAPADVDAISSSGNQMEWAQHLESQLDVFAATDALDDDTLRAELQSALVIAASADYTRLVVSRAFEGLNAATSRRTTITSLESQRLSVQDVLGTLSVAERGTLRGLLQRWLSFSQEAAAGRFTGDLGNDAILFNESYLLERIAALESYELDIVERIARLEYNGLGARFSSASEDTDRAQEQLDGVTERVGSLSVVRKYPDRARNILVPLVGRTSGTRILSTSSGLLQGLLDDARSFVNGYSTELPYIVAAESIQEEIARGNQLANAVGEAGGTALFGRARDLLQRALNEIAAAEGLEDQGLARVDQIESLIERALAANAVENLELAGETLAQAEALLKSDDQRVVDASDLFSESLATWYREDVENSWNATQRELNDSIALAQAEIVITRVQQTVREAQPLVDDQRWSDAFPILQASDDLWSNVFPQTVYPPLERLLRFVQTALAKQNERFLREDDPDFDKLAPILSRANQALSQGLIEDAESLLDQFLRAQPNNLDARLLEVDIALATEEGDLLTKINRLIEGALPDGVERSEISELDAADALEVQSLLIAIESRVEAREDANEALLERLREEIDILELILSPPPVVVVTPDLRAESNALVSAALANGALATLSANQLARALENLEAALEIDPSNETAIDLLGTALRLPNAPRREALDATEQQVVSQARDLFARGDSIGALQLVEQLWADPANRNDTELTRFREELQDAIRRAQ